MGSVGTKLIEDLINRDKRVPQGAASSALFALRTSGLPERPLLAELNGLGVEASRLLSTLEAIHGPYDVGVGSVGLMLGKLLYWASASYLKTNSDSPPYKLVEVPEPWRFVDRLIEDQMANPSALVRTTLTQLREQGPPEQSAQIMLDGEYLLRRVIREMTQKAYYTEETQAEFAALAVELLFWAYQRDRAIAMATNPEALFGEYEKRGGVAMHMRHEAIKMLGRSVADSLGDAKNFVVYDFDTYNPPMEVTIRRKSGDTVARRFLAAVTEAENLRTQLEDMTKERDAALMRPEQPPGTLCLKVPGAD